jgi:hypothetical protein
MFRNSLNSILAVFLVSAVFMSCTKKEEKTDKTAYFRVIRFSETPWDVPAGNHAVSAEEAKKINAYRFSYNDNGKLAAIDYLRDTTLLDYSATGAAHLVFEYTDSTETLTSFNSKAEQIETDGKVWKSVYKLNPEGMRIGLHFYGKTGEAIENKDSINSYVWQKMADGKIREQRFRTNGEETVLNPFCPFYELRFSYDSTGYVKEMANYQADTLYNCTAENCGESGVSYFSFTNNSEGDLLSFEVRNTAGHYSNLYWGWARFNQTIDANGYVLERDYFDQDEEPISGKQAPVRLYTYDEFGAVTEMKNMDAKHLPKEVGPKKIAAIKFEYNNLGQPTDTLRFDGNGVEIAK